MTSATGNVPAAGKMGRGWRRTLIVLSVIEALLMTGPGAGKLLGQAFWTEAFAFWGYPVWFTYLIGVAELAGAIGVLIPPVAAWAAIELMAIMIGAIVTTTMHPYHNFRVVAPAVHICLCAGIVVLRWKERHSAAQSHTPM